MWWPLLLSIGFGALVIVAANRILREYLSGVGLLAALMTLVLLTPLQVVALTGMEHTLHIVLALAFLAMSSNGIAEPARLDRRLLILAPVMVMVRYEGLFLVGITMAFLVVRGVWKFAVCLLLLTLVPVLGYAAIAVANGWEWLPNSILHKGAVIDFQSLAGVLNLLGLRAVTFLSRVPLMVVLTTTLLVAYVATHRAGFWERRRLGLLLSLLALLVHLQFAQLGWVYRYEAYLIAMAIVSLACVAPLVARLPTTNAVVLTVGVVLLLGLASRAATATYRMPRASRNTYSQQWQMASFLKRYYDGASIAANDVGAINYVADLKCLDLVGLANRTIFKHKRSDTYTGAVIQSEAERMQSRIALIYTDWFRGKIPASWTCVGHWRIHDNLLLGGDTVSFYAIGPNEREQLADNLRRFSPTLPASVEAWIE